MSNECEFYSPSCDPAAFWTFLGMSVLLVCAAGMMAGLTMGMLSLDMLNMRILELEGTEEQKKHAARVLPILNQHHLLLVTLLLVNAGANEALPIFLNKLVPEAVSIVLSVTCVLLFGEIIPSAVFTGPNQLRIAAGLAPAVKVLMVVLTPLAFPISKLLDWWLGADHDHAKYKRKELKALIALQRETTIARRHFIENARSAHSGAAGGGDSGAAPPNSAFLPESQPLLTPRAAFAANHYHSTHDTRLHVDEVTIIHGALDLSSKTVTEVMVPMRRVFMLEYSTKLDENRMAGILASGHSRIPVFRGHPSNIVGLLLVKRLIVLDPEDERVIGDLSLRKPIVVTPDESCYAILNEFQKGRSHIALVTRDAPLVLQCWRDGVDVPPTVEFEGICTIEDVIEELIQEEIEDESDVYVHDIVDYWKTKNRKARLQGAAGRNFVKKRLKLLAERARRTVRSRHAKPAAALLPVPGAPAEAHLDAPLQVKIVSEKEPLLPK
ncbi:hypothetical protein PybrP1_005591 [[Pythium] brassicae (nom. inval.)]|nr:hypothetical protein PybrP1_005591 [[Pythium] brassicae (nom. inval.)]